MNIKQIIYLVLALLGVLIPWYYNLQFLSANEGAGIVEFFVAAFSANAATASLTIDITIVYLAFVVWCVVESRKLGMKHWWFYLLWGSCIALASAFPLFLFMRERALKQHANVRL